MSAVRSIFWTICYLAMLMYFPAQAAGKCLIVPVLGLEGSGHHGYMTVFSHMQLQMQNSGDYVTSQFPGNPKMGQHLNKHAASYTKLGQMFSSWSQTCDKGEKEKTCYAMGGGSFPTSRSPWVMKLKQEKRWKPQNWEWLIQNGHPIQLVKFYETVKPFCDVKILLAHRNLVELTYTHKTWDGGLKNHAEVMIFFAKYIDEMLSQLPDDIWKRFDYEDLFGDERDEVLTAVAAWLGVDTNKIDMNKAFDDSGFRKSNSPPPDCKSIQLLHGMQVAQTDVLPRYANASKHILGTRPVPNFWTRSPKRTKVKGCSAPESAQEPAKVIAAAPVAMQVAPVEHLQASPTEQPEPAPVEQPQPTPVEHSLPPPKIEPKAATPKTSEQVTVVIGGQGGGESSTFCWGGWLVALGLLVIRLLGGSQSTKPQQS